MTKPCRTCGGGGCGRPAIEPEPPTDAELACVGKFILAFIALAFTGAFVARLLLP